MLQSGSVSHQQTAVQPPIAAVDTKMTVEDDGESICELMALIVSGDSVAVLEYIKNHSVTAEELNRPDKNGRTCISYAAGRGDTVITDLLLATGLVDPNLADNDGNSPLIYTVSLGHSMVLMKLLGHCPTEIDQCNRNGFTALMKAAIHDHQTCVQLLLQAGARTDKTDATRGMTALQWARLCGSQASAKLLKKNKPPLNKDKSKLSHSASDLTNITSGQTATSPLLSKIKKSLHHHNRQSQSKDHLGVRCIVTCASTPAIPVLLASSGNGDTTPENYIRPLLPQSFCPKVMREVTNCTIRPPKIKITSDTGENIEPKMSIGGNIAKRHQQRHPNKKQEVSAT